MKQLQELFRRLSVQQRITLLTVAIGVMGGVYWFSYWSTERDFKPLLSGLHAEEAGTITAKLKELGVEYRLREDGATIAVPTNKVAEVRLQLAAAGLPSTGRMGFELFDKANFGASEFAEQVNYQRAVEGELERSVMSIAAVETARVHVTQAKDSLYSESRQAAKASVLVKLRLGGTLTPQHVAAITQLAASAVPGLTADQVSVMDSSGNLLSRPKPRGLLDGSEPSEAAVEYRKNIEREIQSKIAATLEPLLGAEHFRIGVSADVDLTSAEQSEETFDPAKSVITSSQKSEDGPALTASSGVPGTASNVPNATANSASAAASTTNYSRHTESVNYQTSKVVKHSKLPQGGIRKLSLSVLVDHSLRWEGQKRVVEPPPPEKLNVIKDLVAAATGLNMDRGDQLVVEAFPFDATLKSEPPGGAPVPQASPAAPGTLPLPPWLQKLMEQKNFALIAGIGAGAMVLLMAAGIFFWSRSRKKKRVKAEAAKVLAGPHGKELTASEQMEAKIAEHAAGQSRKEAEALAALALPEAQTKKTEVLTKHIAAEAKKDPTAVAHVVRSWLNGEYQR